MTAAAADLSSQSNAKVKFQRLSESHLVRSHRLKPKRSANRSTTRVGEKQSA